jgi:hypothetical protein
MYSLFSRGNYVEENLLKNMPIYAFLLVLISEGINQAACGQFGISIIRTRRQKLVTTWIACHLLDRLTEKYGYILSTIQNH